MSDAPSATGRPERKRAKRRREFLDAAARIVADEGFEALTMSRLADHLDTVVSAVYRYFPSKGALLAELQTESLQRLASSLAAINSVASVAFAEQTLSDRDAALTRLVLSGRWMCAASETHPEEIRLLQMIMSQRASALDPGGGMRVFPVALDLISSVVVAIDEAQAAGAIEPGSSIDRAAIWAGALSGVLESDDLEQYLPEVFGGARLARQANLDLLRGWGADADALQRSSDFVDELAASGSLAP